MFDVQHRDERLPAKAWVLGLAVDGDAKAYPFDLLAQRVGPDGRLDDRVGGRKVHIRYDATQRSDRGFAGAIGLGHASAGDGKVVGRGCAKRRGWARHTQEIRLSSDSRYQLASEPVDERWIKDVSGHKPTATVRRIEEARVEWGV